MRARSRARASANQNLSTIRSEKKPIIHPPIPCLEPRAVRTRPGVRLPAAQIVLAQTAGVAVADWAYPIHTRPIVVLPSSQRRGSARHQEQHEAEHCSLAAGESYRGCSERGMGTFSQLPN